MLDYLTRAVAIGVSLFAGVVGVEHARPGLVLLAFALWLLARL